LFSKFRNNHIFFKIFRFRLSEMRRHLQRSDTFARRYMNHKASSVGARPQMHFWCIYSPENVSLMATNIASLPLMEAVSAPSNPLAGFKEPLRSGKKGERKEGRKKETKKRHRRDGKTPPPEIYFWLRPCAAMLPTQSLV